MQSLMYSAETAHQSICFSGVHSEKALRKVTAKGRQRENHSSTTGYPLGFPVQSLVFFSFSMILERYTNPC
jgi:hypothetical protein